MDFRVGKGAGRAVRGTSARGRHGLIGSRPGLFPVDPGLLMRPELVMYFIVPGDFYNCQILNFVVFFILSWSYFVGFLVCKLLDLDLNF